MERLINTLVGYGAQRQNMEIKMFGGANVISAKIDIGERNIMFARSYLRAEHLRIQGQDLGGFAARKITYDVKTGEARVKLIADSRKKDLVASRENALIYHVEHTPYEGSIGIFSE
jgi:chemotaxis protein CheD